MRSSASSPQLSDAANGAQSKVSTLEASKEPVVLSGHPPVDAGSPCGYLFRNFTMLHKCELYYYVLDTKRKRLYEFRDGHVFGIEPKSIIQLHAARLEDELISYKSSWGQLYCWKVFLRAEEDNRPKILNLGATSTAMAEAWIDALRPVVGTGAPNGMRIEFATENGEDLDSISPANSGSRPSPLHTDGANGDSDANTGTPPDPPSAGSAVGGASSFATSMPSPPKTRSWKQPVVVCGETFRIQCSDLSTNAWLLSEAMRTFMRRSANEESTTPDLVALYNVTQDRILDLSEDVGASLVPGDILEALTEDADVIKRLENGSRHRPTRSQHSLSAPGPGVSSSLPATVDKHQTNGKSNGSNKPPSPLNGDGRKPASSVTASSLQQHKQKQKQQQQHPHHTPTKRPESGERGAPSASLPSGTSSGAITRVSKANGRGHASTRLVHGLSWHLSKEMIAAQLAHSKHFLDDREKQEKLILEHFDHLCAAMDMKVPFWAGRTWTPESAENGVRISVHGESALGVLVIPANPSAVLERLLDVRTQLEWDQTLYKVRYLEAARGADVVHMETSLRGPLQKRCFCVARFWMRLDDGSYVGTFTPSAHPSAPSPSGFTPGSMRCAFLLRSSGRYESLLSFLSEVDVHSPLFSSWFNRRAQTSMLASLAGLREASALI
ncbi:Protein ENHANCED DISEASE RESISTANCE 2-like [Hondaea fermentalgiana]|uniref:Protein ENHANCED DISEASE RESISTANCE 2-like n=1 Tax=Hondaea fermentalgiana TaxID=2315210 RepID=A0A2R5GA68_9STRA|nr:Protein ENHANCED DISEASE RESISTANCE 2-like [Hondaea fermentalgiana]|eukprot:GBG24584.1 Protein ENHANCED DISEASE RESISTANCE 2-like [Hondaea fermentalgiana]